MRMSSSVHGATGKRHLLIGHADGPDLSGDPGFLQGLVRLQALLASGKRIVYEEEINVVWQVSHESEMDLGGVDGIDEAHAPKPKRWRESSTPLRVLS
jgi:hypothetical protein